MSPKLSKLDLILAALICFFATGIALALSLDWGKFSIGALALGLVLSFPVVMWLERRQVSAGHAPETSLSAPVSDKATARSLELASLALLLLCAPLVLMLILAGFKVSFAVGCASVAGGVAAVALGRVVQKAQRTASTWPYVLTLTIALFATFLALTKLGGLAWVT